MQHPIPFPKQPERIRLEDAIVDWQKTLTALGHLPQGRKRYLCHVRKFSTWLPVAYLDEVKPYHIKRYRDEIGQTLATGTVNLAICSIGSLFNWAVEHEYIETNPTDRIKRPKVTLPPPKDLTEDELSALFQALARVGREPWQHDYAVYLQMWQRNRRAVFLALYAGLRLAELTVLRWTDVDLVRQEVRVVFGKGGKHRTVPMHPDLHKELSAAPDRAPDNAVIGKPDGSPLSIKSIAHIFERWLPARGVDITAHRLRHTFATSLMHAGVSLREIQVALGHESIETTQRYLGVSGSHLRRSIEKLDYGSYKSK